MPPAFHQVSATPLKLLIQQIHPDMRVERDSGVLGKDAQEKRHRFVPGKDARAAVSFVSCKDSQEQRYRFVPGMGVITREKRRQGPRRDGHRRRRHGRGLCWGHGRGIRNQENKTQKGGFSGFVFAGCRAREGMVVLCEKPSPIYKDLVMSYMCNIFLPNINPVYFYDV
jgi:hypothetical protein